MAESYLLFKVLILGEKCVGKSSLMKRYTEDIFSSKYQSTIGVMFDNKMVEHRGEKIKLQMWDMACRETCKAVIRRYSAASQGALLIFDVTERSTFNSLDGWIADVKSVFPKDTAIVLVGNKCDNVDGRCVTEKQAKSLARKNKMLYTDASSKENTNVTKAFSMLTEGMYAQYSRKMNIDGAEVVPSYWSLDQETDSEIEDDDDQGLTDCREQNSDESGKIDNAGKCDLPDWVSEVLGGLKLHEDSFNTDELSETIDTLCKKIDDLETRINRLEKLREKKETCY